MTFNKLFCLPYAGGSAVMYLKWSIEGVEIIPLEYAGRGLRADKPFDKSFEHLVEDVYSLLKTQVKAGDRYAMFGHSMGTYVVYELYRKIVRDNLTPPEHIFLSAAVAPDKIAEIKRIAYLDDSTFVDEVKKLGGLPDEIVNAKEFANSFLKVIRSDFQLFEQYEFQDDHTIMNCPVTVFFGDRDGIGFDAVIRWRRFASGDFSVNGFNGDHFYINTEWKSVVAQVKRYLET